MKKVKHETVELDMDADVMKVIDGVRKYTVHDLKTVAEVLIGLWAWKEVARRKERNELCP